MTTMRWLCVMVMCISAVLAPLGVVVPAGAQPPAELLDDLVPATARTTMKGSLKGALQQTINAARRNLEAGNVEAAGAAIEAYIGLLEAQQGAGITPQAAGPLIAAANEALAALFAYPFAADYDGIPILATGPTGPASVDWRAKGVVTGVGDQGQCSSDYDFSAIGAVEGAWGITKGQLTNLSEQQIIDCDGASVGCEGGSPVRALEFGLANQGFVTEQSYPYTALDGTCKSATPVVTISSLGRPVPGDEAALASAVANVGPVSAVLRVRGTAWDTYAGGLFDPATAASGVPRYVAVLIVGYGDQGGTPYWIVKTSNGTDWGNQGYVLIPRGQNALGIADYVVVPIV